MKFLCLIFVCIYFYSCSNSSNPANNSNNQTDSMFIYFDSLSYWGGPSGSNTISAANSDTLIRNVRISFEGDTDYDSTTIQAIVIGDTVEYVYFKKGKSEINVDHTFSVNISNAKTHTYSFYVTMFYPGISNHVKLKFIRVSMIRS